MAGAEQARSTARPVRSLELLGMLWRLLSSAQFAIAVTAFLALAGLLAVVIPQVPVAMQDNPVAVSAWLESERGTFGFMTTPMDRLGLFNVVKTWWFLTGLGTLAVSVSVYIIDRFADIWRNVTRPRQQVPDSFFERAANRTAFATPETGVASTAQQLDGLLSARRFKVRTTVDGETTYLFADRFAWAQFGNFATHFALVLFLAGGLLTHFGGYTNALLIAEGTTSPVFAVSDPNQMQVEVVDAVAQFDENGRAKDYRTELNIYQGGKQVAHGYTTVNNPLSYHGYRFHQAGYFGDGAALRIRDVATGNTVYDEVLELSDLSPAPEVLVRDANGAVLLDDTIVPTDYIGDANGTLITVPGTDRDFWVGIIPNTDTQTWSLAVYEQGNTQASFVAPAGEAHPAGGLEWTLKEVTGLPSTVSDGISPDGRALTVLSETPEGDPYLTVLGAVDSQALTLAENAPVVVDGRQYTFEGRREFAGIEVRKDPGVNFIWIAAGLLLLGLLTTFYLPRLRLWARIRGDQTVVASQAERRGVFQNESKHLLEALNAARIEPEEEAQQSD